MGLLKAIKYLTFEVSVLKEIVDGWIVRMNISGMDFTRFLYRLNWTNNVMKKRFNGLLWLVGHCGDHEDGLITWIIAPQ